MFLAGGSVPPAPTGCPLVLWADTEALPYKRSEGMYVGAGPRPARGRLWEPPLPHVTDLGKRKRTPNGVL